MLLCTVCVLPAVTRLTRSGMFCAITTTIERCKTEGVVDVFQVVKALRVQKPGAVHTAVSIQYIALHRTLVDSHSITCFPHSSSTTPCLRLCSCIWTPLRRTATFKTCEPLQCAISAELILADSYSIHVHE